MSEGQQRAAAPKSARIESLDALRGVAVLGIFIINITLFGLGESLFGNPVQVGGNTPLDNGLWSFAQVYVNGTMRGLFSMMFGAGVVLFTMRAAYPDGPIRVADLYYRRTFWLIIFGLVHGYLLLAPGDILLIYGIAGLILFPFRILKPRTLLTIGLVLMALLVLDRESYETQESLLQQRAADIAALQKSGAEISAEDQNILLEWQETERGNWWSEEELEETREGRTGDLESIYEQNTKWVDGENSFEGTLWWTLDAMIMMFIGMALFKLGVLTNERSFRFYAIMAVGGYVLGLGIRTFWMMQRWDADFSTSLWAWSVFDQPVKLIVTLGHVGAFFCMWKLLSHTRVMRALAATGRMALTNYIGQTIIANLIFTGIGLGLYMTLTISDVYLVMLGVWLFQILFSAWWLSRFRFGPLEWVWRAMTYGKLPQNKRQA